MITENIIINLTYEQVKKIKIGNTVSKTNKGYKAYNGITHEIIQELGVNNVELYCTATYLHEKTIYHPATLKYDYIDDYIEYFYRLDKINAITVSVYDVDYSIIEYHKQAITGTNQYMIEQEQECLEDMKNEWNARDIYYDDIERTVTFYY